MKKIVVMYLFDEILWYFKIGVKFFWKKRFIEVFVVLWYYIIRVIRESDVLRYMKNRVNESGSMFFKISISKILLILI